MDHLFTVHPFDAPLRSVPTTTMNTHRSSRPSHFVPLVVGIALLASCGEKVEEKVAETPPPIIDMKDFFKNPEKASFQISPDGDYMSYRAPWKNRMNIFVQKMGDSAATQVTHDTIRDVGGYFWKGDRLVYSRDINGDENFIVFSAGIAGCNVILVSFYLGEYLLQK